jgi:single-strand DNA-binding protein
MNSCNFCGRLTKDPELKTTQSGKKYTRFCLAVDGIKDKDGNKTADFVDCIAWNKSAEIIAQYARKGSKLGVNGRYHTTTYDKDGEKRKSIDIVVNEFELLDSKPKDQPAQAEQPQYQPDPAETPSELPFEL